MIRSALENLADCLLAAVLSAPVVYGSAVALGVLLAAGIGWPWVLLLIGAGNIAVAVWWCVHVLVTRRPW